MGIGNSIDQNLDRVFIRFKKVVARVKRLEAMMIGASASIIAMLVMVLTRMP